MIIYGASGHAKVIIDVLRSQDLPLSAIFDDNPEIKELLGYKVRHNFNPAEYRGKELIIAIGNNAIRKRIAENSTALNPAPMAINHPSSILSDNVELGNGTVVLHGATVQSSTCTGRYVIINTGSTVDHDCALGDYVHVAPNATLCGGVSVGEGTLVGAGSVVIPTVKIGKWCVIGAGTVVIRDVPDYSMVVGNPGRIVKNLNI